MRVLKKLVTLLMISSIKLIVNAKETVVNDVEAYQKIEYKGTFLLTPSSERMIITHLSDGMIEYILTNQDLVSSIDYSYTNSDNVIIKLDTSNKANPNLRFSVHGNGNNWIKLNARLKLKNGDNYTVNTNLYVFSYDNYDFISVASLGDAKFYCYEYLTGTENPNYEDYDKFFNQENIDSKYVVSSKEMQSLVGDLVSPLSCAPSKLTVYGTITWRDKNYDSHPAKNIKVEIIDEDILGINNKIATLYTDENGFYSCTFNNTTFLENGGLDIKCRISAEGGNVSVINNSEVAYTYTSTTYMNYKEATLEISYDFDDRKVGKQEEKDRARAIQVHQALEFAATYVEEKGGNRLNNINIFYPTTKYTSMFSGGNLYILEGDRNDWDVMIHEYGHYVQHNYDTTASLGGNHSLGSCLAALHGKKDGIRLAWGEGWPTYFSISSQLEMNASSLNIPYVGDLVYSDTDDTNFHVDFENPDQYDIQYGESNEMAIVAALLDFAGAGNDNSVSLGYTYIWNVINNNKCKTFSEFMNSIQSDNYEFEYFKYGNILSNLLISPTLSAPSNFASATYELPTFSWVSNGGILEAAVDYRNNLFSIVFFDCYGNYICETPETTSTSMTVSESIWEQVLNTKGSYVNWAVKSYQTTEYKTGYYFSNYYSLYKPEPIQISNALDRVGSLTSGDYIWYKFVAPYNGTFTFETKGSTDTYGELFSSIASSRSVAGRLTNGYNDDGGEGNNFKLVYDLDYLQVVYLRVRGYNWSATGEYTLSVEYDHSQHIYNKYIMYNKDKHKAACACGDYVLQPHAITATTSTRYANCIQCGALVDLGNTIVIVGPTSSLVKLVTINGSYITTNGIVVLVDKDIEAYLNGTLIFYYKNNVIA